MAELLVVTGPPGSGKSSTAPAVAQHFERAALVPGDDFYGFVARGDVDPWLPEADAQNVTVTQAAAAACGRFVSGGFDVVYDGMVGPWFADTFLAATGLTRMRYVILLPSEDTCVARVRSRTGHGFTDLPAARHMYGQFREACERNIGEFAAALPTIDPRCVLLEPQGSPAEIAADIAYRAAAGELDYWIDRP